MNYADLWTQDVSRRLGYAIDAKLTGKDLVKELKARLPKMKKADVDRAIKKHLQMDDFSVAIVADKASAVRDTLARRQAHPDHLRHGTARPPAIVEEDKEIAREPLPVRAETIRIVPAEQMFER